MGFIEFLDVLKFQKCRKYREYRKPWHKCIAFGANQHLRGTEVYAWTHMHWSVVDVQ